MKLRKPELVTVYKFKTLILQKNRRSTPNEQEEAIS